MKMAEYPALEEMGQEQALAALRSNGFERSIAEPLSEAICNPVRRGSAILVDVSSETLETKDYSQTGPGFFWLIGEKSSWIMSFDDTDMETIATILPGTAQTAEKLLKGLLG